MIKVNYAQPVLSPVQFYSLDKSVVSRSELANQFFLLSTSSLTGAAVFFGLQNLSNLQNLAPKFEALLNCLISLTLSQT